MLQNGSNQEFIVAYKRNVVKQNVLKQLNEIMKMGDHQLIVLIFCSWTSIINAIILLS